jgi:hypothetical protein
MYNANKPDASELPSTGKLLKSTGIAAVIATALLVTVVLPAEYGVDPTRIGSVLGLTEMGRIKMQLAAEAEAEEAGLAVAETAPAAGATTGPADTASVTSDQRSDETVITLAPDRAFSSPGKAVVEQSTTTPTPTGPAPPITATARGQSNASRANLSLHSTEATAGSGVTARVSRSPSPCAPRALTPRSSGWCRCSISS